MLSRLTVILIMFAATYAGAEQKAAMSNDQSDFFETIDIVEQHLSTLCNQKTATAEAVASAFRQVGREVSRLINTPVKSEIAAEVVGEFETNLVDEELFAQCMAIEKR